MKKYILFISLMITGCITPNNWEPEQHQATMILCRKMCEDTYVVKYEPLTGDCTCAKK